MCCLDFLSTFSFVGFTYCCTRGRLFGVCHYGEKQVGPYALEYVIVFLTRINFLLCQDRRRKRRNTGCLWMVYLLFCCISLETSLRVSLLGFGEYIYLSQLISFVSLHDADIILFHTLDSFQLRRCSEKCLKTLMLRTIWCIGPVAYNLHFLHLQNIL